MVVMLIGGVGIRDKSILDLVLLRMVVMLPMHVVYLIDELIVCWYY